LRHLATLRPELTRFATPADLTTWFEHSQDPTARNAILGDLLALAPDHDLAARAALQVMLPGLCALARRVRAHDLAVLGDDRCWPTIVDAHHDVLAVAAEHIARGTAAAARWPALRLLSRVEAVLRTAVRYRQRDYDHTEPVADITRVETEWRDVLSPAESIGALLTDAVKAKVVQRDDAQLIYEFHVLGRPTESSAARQQRPAAMVRQRRNRAVNALAVAAARGELDPPELEAA
jgi:hypothetical protein